MIVNTEPNIGNKLVKGAIVGGGVVAAAALGYSMVTGGAGEAARAQSPLQPVAPDAGRNLVLEQDQIPKQAPIEGSVTNENQATVTKLGEYTIAPIEGSVYKVEFGDTDPNKVAVIKQKLTEQGLDPSQFTDQNFVVRDIDLTEGDEAGSAGKQELTTVTYWDQAAQRVRRWSVWQQQSDGSIGLTTEGGAALTAEQALLLEMDRSTASDGDGRNSIDYKGQPLAHFTQGGGWSLMPLTRKDAAGYSQTGMLWVNLDKPSQYQFEPWLAWTPEAFME